MRRSAHLRTIIGAGACGIVACLSGPTGAAQLTLANPAAVLCEKDGATVVIATMPNGAQQGICVFPGGARINEWAYFRNKHRTKN